MIYEATSKWINMRAFCLFTWLIVASSVTCAQNTENYFAAKMIEIHGTNGSLSVDQLQKLLDVLQSKEGHENTHSPSTEDKTSRQITQDVPCQNMSSSPEKCITTKCLGANDIFSYHKMPKTGADVSGFTQMSSMILYQIQRSNCSTEILEHKGPSDSAVWGFGFLCVTLINLCALMGLVFLPLMRKSFYQHILLFMVALAVGTLAGSSILFLVPETFGLTEEEKPLSESYIWKSTTILGGIYLFFLVERILKIVMEWRVRLQDKKLCKRTERPRSANGMESLQYYPMASVKTCDIHTEDSMNMSFKPPPETVIKSSRSLQQLTTSIVSELWNGKSHSLLKMDALSDEHVVHHNNKPVIKPVAWMVIFGDGLHNFIDGLSIGAAFTQSTLSGISISLAVVCEELPHELGDFAILLNSGMSMKQALVYNFLSACMCYLGLIFGIVLGENTQGSHWVFAIAAGMFLYISLVDMLPEVNHAAEEKETETGKVWPVFLLQNLGILMGYGIMVFLAVFGGRIDLSQFE